MRAATGSIRFREIRCQTPKSRRIPYRTDVLAWNVDEGATFATGTCLASLCHYGVFGSSFDSLTAPEPGVLVSIDRPVPSSVREGDVLARYIALAEWETFTALLDLHDDFVARYRANGDVDERERREILKQAATLTRKNEHLKKRRRTVDAIGKKIHRAIAEQEQRATTLSSTLHAQIASVRDEIAQYPIDRLVGLFLSRHQDFHACRSRRADVALIAALSAALRSILERSCSIPYDELSVVRSHFATVQDLFTALTDYDRVFSRLLADPCLDETARTADIREQRQQRLKFVNAAFKENAP